MEIRFLGKETEHLHSPTLYATGQGTYLIQGWKVTDPEILAKLDVPESETVVEIYARLVTHLGWTQRSRDELDSSDRARQGERKPGHPGPAGNRS